MEKMVPFFSQSLLGGSLHNFPCYLEIKTLALGYHSAAPISPHLLLLLLLWSKRKERERWKCKGERVRE